MKYDVVIIGGGAAGLFCSIQAGKRGLKTLVIEHNSQVGRKILVSGGGRCNFTNRNVSAHNFVSKNAHFCKSALAKFTPSDFVELINRYKIEFYEKKLGQLFCKNSAREIVEMLLSECRRANVEIRLNCSVNKVSKDSFFKIETNNGQFFAEKLVIATGGLSFPKIGATDFGLKIARQFEMKIVETRPSLVALKFAEDDFRDLSGVSLDAIVKSGKNQFQENILFTHTGLSGPAILQISNYWIKDKPLVINLLPGLNTEKVLEDNQSNKQSLHNFLSQYLPNRFVEKFVSEKRPINQIGNRELSRIAERLNDWHVKLVETQGYDKAEVMIGGVDTNELSSQTMESKRVTGLYFIGEVIDVTGWLGGYNFQWAWSSGYVCGQSL